jgi:hypothetical protein
MSWKRSVLVVANVTATSEDLVQALRIRAAAQATSFTVVIPATPFGGGREAAHEQLEQALEHLRESGLEVAGAVGDADPMIAVIEAWDPKRYDEIIVSTLPMRFSKWLHAGLPERIERATGAPVTHLVSSPPKPSVQTVPAPAHARSELGPLAVLGWGAAKRR